VTYCYSLVLKKINNHVWHLLTKDGRLIHEMILCSSRYDAEDRAKKYVSSWGSLLLEIEENNE